MNSEPRVSRARILSPVWFIPLLALLIAGWLAVRAWQSAGPVIEIEFRDAAGIAVGKTRVRYRDVDVGEVKAIRLSDDFKSVQVSVEMAAYVEPLITDQSNFWVVSPRISRSGISGIETLLSGVYIEMDAGSEGTGESKSSFIGLDEPPSVRSYDKGTSYVLMADTLGSLDIGSQIYHRQVPVGEVTGYKLLPEQGKVQIRFFVKAPHDQLVQPHSQFWNVSGFGANIGLQGVELKVGSLRSLIAGGIEFDTPGPLGAGSQAAPGRNFYLFADRKAVREGAYSVSYPFQLRFSGSVRGLKLGAPVEYMGLQVGQVEQISLDTNGQPGRHIDVLVSIQPERMYPGDSVPTEEDVRGMMATLVGEGMKAKLTSGSLIGGSLFVDLVPRAGKPAEIEQRGDYAVLPTSEGGYAQIVKQLGTIVERVQGIPIEEIGVDLQGSMKELRTVMEQLRKANLAAGANDVLGNLKQATGGLDGTLAQLEQTLRSVDQTVSPDSALSHTLTEALEDISDAAKSMEQLTSELFRYPDSLLRGKGGESE